ncbi:MAG TPA: NAD-dependent epimerase/dehydratase family protein [Steroidobacteraceae bacterium]|nr:NAD-dependent epimerase/dehydratase family protein [Steroidobacteraceae bacterium]
MSIALVTGATGLIGHTVARQLIAAGHSVRLLVREPQRAAPMVPADAEIVRGDITDSASLAPAVAGVEWVFHAAGMPEQWQRDPGLFDRVNRLGTRNVLEAALAAGVRRVLYTSTMDVFATDPSGRLTEALRDERPKPTAYERSKQAAEREADALRARGLDVVFLNPAAVYGPSPVHVSLNSFFLQILRRQSPVLPPGGMSVAYVDAVARAHLVAAERGRNGERYLLADEHVSVRELAAAVLHEAGLGRIPPTAPAAALKVVAAVSEPLARTFGFRPLLARGQLSYVLWNARVDASKARRELDYVPVPLAEGVKRTLESFRRQGLF